jgi:hypothetical protein
MSTPTKEDQQVNVSEWIAHAIVDCGVKVVYGTLMIVWGAGSLVAPVQAG